MSVKRVLIFSLNYYPRFIGGAEVAIKEITDRIPHEDYEFHVLTLRFDKNLPKTEKIGNVLVHRIGAVVPNPSIADLGKPPLHYMKYWYQLAAVWHALRLHAQYKFDIIWAMMAHSCGIPAGIFKSLFPGVKYVLTLQEGDPPEYIERTMRPVMGLFTQGFTKADALQSISTFLMEWGKRMGFNGDARLIPNGVNTAKFEQEFSSQEVDTMKRELNKKEGEIFLVTTSRLVHKNALDDVIHAVPAMPESVTFLIYGIGPDEEMLRALAQELKIEHRVRFMGEIGHDRMPLMLKACDIFTRPSRSEGMGNSFIEAMAAGLPVIATQEGGIRDFLFDVTRNPDKPSTGWAVDANAPDQIADAVRGILADESGRIQTIKNARQMVHSQYDWNTIAGQMKELFDSLA